jgi:HSP20 family molecular chaperone IbpA
MWVNWYLFDLMFPKYDLYRCPMWSEYEETEEGMKLEIAIPGYEKEDFQLYSEDGTLYLKILREDRQALYSISGRDYDSEGAKAEYKNGILIITVPKAKKEQKKLEIKVS